MECHNATKSVNREVSFDSCVNSTALSVWVVKTLHKAIKSHYICYCVCTAGVKSEKCHSDTLICVSR